MFALILAFAVATDKPLCQPYTGKLTDIQQKQLDRLIIRKTTVAYSVVKFDIGGLNQNSIIIKCKILNLEMRGAEIKSEKIPDIGSFKGISWKDKGNQAILSMASDGSTLVGLIFYDNKVYGVEMLADGVAVIFQIDQTKFPKD